MDGRPVPGGEAVPPSAELIEIMRKVAPAGPPPAKVDEGGPAPSYGEEWEWSDGTVGDPVIPGWVEDTDPYYGDSLDVPDLTGEEEEEPAAGGTAELLAQAAAARERLRRPKA